MIVDRAHAHVRNTKEGKKGGYAIFDTSPSEKTNESKDERIKQAEPTEDKQSHNKSSSQPSPSKLAIHCLEVLSLASCFACLLS